MGVLFWLAIWVFVAAPLALVVCCLMVRMSGDGLPKADPYSGALDPTLLDTDAPRDRQPAERPAPSQPALHETIASDFQSSGASRVLTAKAPLMGSPVADGTGNTSIKDGRRSA